MVRERRELIICDCFVSLVRWIRVQGFLIEFEFFSIGETIIRRADGHYLL